MVSISLMIMLFGILPTFLKIDVSNHIILGISIFTFLYSLAESPLLKKEFSKVFVTLSSAPFGLILAAISYSIQIEEIKIIRVTNSITLITLGIMIFTITLNENFTDNNEDTK